MPTKTQTPATELPTQPDQQQAISYFLTKKPRSKYYEAHMVKSDADAVYFKMKHPKAIYKNEYGNYFYICIEPPSMNCPEYHEYAMKPVGTETKANINIIKEYLKSIKYRSIAKMNIDEWDDSYKLSLWDEKDNICEYTGDYRSYGNQVFFGITKDNHDPENNELIKIETTNFDIACQIALLFNKNVYIHNQQILPSFPCQYVQYKP